MGTELLDLSEARGREVGTEDIGFCGVLGCRALLMSAKFSGIRAHVCGGSGRACGPDYAYRVSGGWVLAEPWHPREIWILSVGT